MPARITGVTRRARSTPPRPSSWTTSSWRGKSCASCSEQLGGIEVIGQAGNGIEALRVIEEHQPDLVMLDVQMPGLTGFEVARRLLEAGVESQVVFVTAFDQHAIEAFEVNAVDYLLKPVEPERLATAVERARRRAAADARRASARGDDLERLLQLLADRQGRREQLAVKVGGPVPAGPGGRGGPCLGGGRRNHGL